MVLRCFGKCCEFLPQQTQIEGDPWEVLRTVFRNSSCQVSEPGFGFPVGGLFGFWGYELRRFTEPRVGTSRGKALPASLPDCQVGVYSSVVIFDDASGKAFIACCGLDAEGHFSAGAERSELAWWTTLLQGEPIRKRVDVEPGSSVGNRQQLHSDLTKARFVGSVQLAQEYIRQGDIYQVNLSHRLTVPTPLPAWELFHKLQTTSPAPCSAFYDGGSFQLASASPELFLRLSGERVWTRPIKGTRARSPDTAQDFRLACELQASPKEKAELVMITDLMRNDLGRVCQYGSVKVSDLLRLEQFSHVQHLVSTVQGSLRDDVDHLRALASLFPGGSVTGAPKVRAMELIDLLESSVRGPYTGAIGFLGFNRESQLNMIIRTAVSAGHQTWFNVGAGIVADSDPEAEWAETLAKARGFAEAVGAELPET